MSTLVTGASGFIGSALCAFLVRKGELVSAATRSKPEKPIHGVDYRVVSNLGPDTNWAEALKGVHSVVHCAARVHIMNETSKDPLAIFSLKDPDTFIVKLRRTYETLDFLTINRNQYQITIDQLDECVQACLDKGLLIVPVTEEVETALTYGPNLPFREEFKETDLYNKLFQYQKDGIEHVVKHFDGRALIADDMGLGKTLQASHGCSYSSPAAVPGSPRKENI